MRPWPSGLRWWTTWVKARSAGLMSKPTSSFASRAAQSMTDSPASRCPEAEARGFHDSRTLVDGNPRRDDLSRAGEGRVSYATVTFAAGIASWMRGDTPVLTT